MMPMNNPMLRMQQLLQGGKTPRQALSILSQETPQAGQILQMMQTKTSQEIEQMARNMAKERGTTLEDVAKSLGIQIPSNR